MPDLNHQCLGEKKIGESMISLSRVSEKMGRHYYTSDSYYTKDGMLENSEWFGKGAVLKELKGHVDPKIFQSLMQLQTQTNPNARIGLDMTFSAPKSVSLLYLVAGDSRILKAHHDAVDTALKFVEDRYSYTRTGAKENRKIEVSGNICVAKFTHDLSRAKDPQLHTHCVLFNTVKRSDGLWRSFHNDGIFNNSKLFGLIYQNELAHEIKKLGYEIHVKQNGTFEIEGYSDTQLRAFSKRTKHIESLGCQTKKQERIEKLIDRPTKGKAVSRQLLQQQWVEECHNVHILHPVPKSSITTPHHLQNQIAHTNLQDAIDHIVEKDVRFKKEQAEKYVLHQNIGSVPFQFYQKEFSNLKQDKTLLEYQKGMFTTKEALLVEEHMLKKIEFGKNRFDSIENNATKITDHYETLTHGQKNALITSLMSRDQFIAWQGVAGAGKTYALNILRSIATENGYRVKGFAQSAEASQVLYNEAKIPSQTVASLLTSEATSQINPYKTKEMWIVDEAGLLGAVDCSKLIENAVNKNARVIFVGDTKQMPAISAGNPFQLMQDHGIQIACLQESLRQKKLNLKQAVDCIANDQIHHGLKHIQDHVHEVKDFDQKILWIRDKYSKLSPEEQNKTLILSSSNDERSQIIREIRDDLKKNQCLTNTVNIDQFIPKHQTHAESRSILNYQINDVLIFYKVHPKQSLKKNKSYSIQSIDQKNNTLMIRDLNDSFGRTIPVSPRIGGFTAYTQKKLEVAIGDKIKWTKNDRDLEVRNGQDFIVTKTDSSEITLRSQQGKTVTFSTQRPLHVDYNYVHTVYSSQGKTCDKVIISEDKNFGKEMLYVALSRAKHDILIVSQNKEQFLQSTHTSNKKLSATDLVKEAKCHISMTHTKSITRKGVSCI